MRIYATFMRRDDGLPPEYRLLVAVWKRAVADTQRQRDWYPYYDPARFVEEFVDTLALLHSPSSIGYTEESE